MPLIIWLVVATVMIVGAEKAKGCPLDMECVGSIGNVEVRKNGIFQNNKYLYSRAKVLPVVEKEQESSENYEEFDANWQQDQDLLFEAMELKDGPSKQEVGKCYTMKLGLLIVCKESDYEYTEYIQQDDEYIRTKPEELMLSAHERFLDTAVPRPTNIKD